MCESTSLKRMMKFNLNVRACPHEWNVIYLPPSSTDLMRPLPGIASIFLLLFTMLMFWYNFYKYCFKNIGAFPTNSFLQILVWWATYLCTELGPLMHVFAFFIWINRGLLCLSGRALSIIFLFSILCITDLACSVHCQRRVACRIFH